MDQFYSSDKLLNILKHIYAEFNLFKYKNICQNALIPYPIHQNYIFAHLIVKTKNVIQKMDKLTKINKINIILNASKNKLSIIMKNSKLKVVAIILMMKMIVVTMILVNKLLPLK